MKRSLYSRRLLLLCAAASALAGCAPVTQRPALEEKAIAEEALKQRALAWQDLQEDVARLYRVSYPILARAADLCDDKLRSSVGARFANAPSIAKEFRESAAKLTGLGDHLQVLQLAPGAPAERAGLREKDLLLAIDGKSTPSGEGAQAKLIAMLEEAAKTRKQLDFKIRRDSVEQVLRIDLEPVCDYPVVVNSADIINAFADGKQVAITRGMLRFVRDDLELAVVVGHELAHNTMGHIRKQMGNAFLGTVLDVLAASRGVDTQGLFGNIAGMVFSKDFEAEADYVGLYFTARAGHEIDNAPNFWRRMAAANPGGIQQRGFGSSHPSTPERFLALEKIVAEIKAKKAAGQILAPQLQK
ncbi:MAG: hypothetical protein EXR30_01515 [Betaproteobacteria bacterium]|nr:hypothetical protein [Betaproteobacteria bacterium]